jgi:hypothetical protein
MLDFLKNRSLRENSLKTTECVHSHVHAIALRVVGGDEKGSLESERSATGYGLENRGVGARVPVGQEFSVLQVVQTGSGIHTTSYTMSIVGYFPGGKAGKADHSPPTSAEVKEMWIYTSTPPYAANIVILGSESRVTHDHILLSQN